MDASTGWKDPAGLEQIGKRDPLHEAKIKQINGSIGGPWVTIGFP